jgi:RNA polymerase sigma factor (sigma-70 family)
MTLEQDLCADVRSAREGDREAYRRLVDRTASTVCSIAFSIVREIPASQDVAQEAYLAAWSGLSKLRNTASFLPWLRQITRNQARLWLRERRREATDSGDLTFFPDARSTPVERLLEAEERQVLSEVLDALPDESREVVLLFYREGSSARHVAGLLGISEDAVKQRLSRARAKVREGVLRRFGDAARRSAPGSALGAAVAAALIAGAPCATAAASVGGGGAASLGSKLLLLAKGSAPGSLAGALGIYMAEKHLGEPHDERERQELRNLRGTALGVVVSANLLFAAAVRWKPVTALLLSIYLCYLGSMIYLYRVRLGGILQRRPVPKDRPRPCFELLPERWEMPGTSVHAQAYFAAVSGATMMVSLYFLLR